MQPILSKVLAMVSATREVACASLASVLVVSASLGASAAHAFVGNVGAIAPADGAESRAQQRLEWAGELSTMFKRCGTSVAGFEVKNRAQLKVWARKNAATLVELEQSKLLGPAYRERLAAAGKPAPASWTDDLTEQCDAIAQSELGQKPSGPPAASPQQAWDSFTAALRKADKASALLCLSPEIRSQYRQVFDGMTPDAMRSMADHIKVVRMSKLIGGSSPDTATLATALAETRDGNGGEIMFVKSKLNGRWQIGSM